MVPSRSWFKRSSDLHAADVQGGADNPHISEIFEMSFQNSQKLFFWEVTPLPHDGLGAGEVLVPLTSEKVHGSC